MCLGETVKLILDLIAFPQPENSYGFEVSSQKLNAKQDESFFLSLSIFGHAQPGESQGWSRTESDTTEVTQQQQQQQHDGSQSLNRDQTCIPHGPPAKSQQEESFHESVIFISALEDRATILPENINYSIILPYK